MGYRRDCVLQSGKKYGYKRGKMSLEQAGLPPLAELLIKGVVRLDGANAAGVWERLKNASLVDCTPLVKSDSWPTKEEVQERWGSTEETLVLGCDKLEDFILPREQTWFEYFGPVSGNLTAMTLTETAGGDSYDVDILELRIVLCSLHRAKADLLLNCSTMIRMVVWGSGSKHRTQAPCSITSVPMDTWRLWFIACAL